MSAMNRDTKNHPGCVEAEFWLSVRVDGERVPEQKGAALERHLSACPSCRRAFLLETKRAEILRGALSVGPELSGARLVDSLRAARESEPSAPHPLWARRWSLSAAAALLICVLLGVLVPALQERTGASNAGGGTSSTASMLPVSNHPHRAARGYNIVLELNSERATIVPARDGAPLRQDTVRQVRFLIDSLGGGQGDPAGEGVGPEGGGSRTGVGIERVDTRYSTLTSYPYQ
jgi:hypothetical protein